MLGHGTTGAYSREQASFRETQEDTGTGIGRPLHSEAGSMKREHSHDEGLVALAETHERHDQTCRISMSNKESLPDLCRFSAPHATMMDGTVRTI